MGRSLRSSIERWPLARPFRISRGVKTVAEVVVVELEADGIVGRGEAVPYARYGETPDSVIAQIAGVRPALIAGADRGAVAALLPAGAARNAVDCALWDHEERRSPDRIAVTTPGPIEIALTIGLDEPAAMAAAAAELADVPLIKVKVDGRQPEACLRAVRAAAPRPRLIVDPNESWDLDLLARLQPLLAELGTSFVEQPVAAENDAALAGFARLVPICADESVHTRDHLGDLRGRYDIVNIKLDKTGGLTEALALLDAARAQGFGVMVGCMICTSLSIAPALRVARQADFADLDGPLWLTEDRPGGVKLDAGRLLPPASGFWGGADVR